jgi:hypothetical protein
MTFSRRALLALSYATLGACIEDADRCGPNMSYDVAVDTCVCAENAIATAGGCTPCADDEVVFGTTCGCPTGMAKNDSNVCTTVAGLGDACDESTPCGDATYSYCAPSTGGATAGTCTKTCTTDDDCGASFTCATWEAQPFCREFSGVGASCSAQGDCAAFDAQACDMVQSHSCVVAGCSVDDDNCPRGTTCCDLSAYGAGTICMGACP